MRSGQVPRLSTVSARSLNLPGAGQNSPKLPLSAIIVTAVGWPTLAVAATVMFGNVGSLLAITRLVDAAPAAVGVNATCTGKQKSWLIVIGKPPDGAVIVNCGLDEVTEFTMRSPGLVL